MPLRLILTAAVVLVLASLSPAADKEPPVTFAAPWTSPFRVDPAHPQHLVNAEGKHLFILNKTGWAYFGCKDPEGYLKRAKEEGVTVIRVALEGRPYWDTLKLDLWPFAGTRDRPEHAAFSPAYWAEVERRIELAGKAGIGLNITLFYSLHPEEIQFDTFKPYFRETVSRLGRYANVLCWEIQNEWLLNEKFQDLAGPFLQQLDPTRPVITSDHTFDTPAWPHKPWVSMAITHTCTGSGNGPYTLAGWYLPVARNTRAAGKPAWCNESGREKRHKNDDGVHRRKQGWLWYAAGCYWTWHSWDGCEGIDDKESKAPGREFMKPLAEFWSGLPFHTLSPNATTVTVPAEADIVSADLADGDRTFIVAYFATERTGRRVENATAQLRLPPGKYTLTFVSPRDNKVLETRAHTSKHIKELTPLPLPAFDDDLALTITRTEKHDRTMIPGTQ